MTNEEIQSRAAFQILMSARVHATRSHGHNKETDGILGRAIMELLDVLRPLPTPANYSIHWTAHAGLKVSKPDVGNEIDGRYLRLNIQKTDK